MKAESNQGASGFSLIELTIAMVVTLIVSGAIFGLLTGGKTAFRREPEGGKVRAPKGRVVANGDGPGFGRGTESATET